MNLREPLHFIRKALSPRKTWNVAVAMTSYGLSRLTRRPFAWGVPPVLMIEPTNWCNLRCPLCPSGNGTLRRPRGFMDPALFHRVVDQVRGRALMVLLWNQGESFLHEDFLGLVRYAAAAGLYTMASTNGHFLRDPDAIVRSGLDSLIISIDGATEETYRQYRVGGSFEKVIEGTKAVVAAKRRLRSRTPIIHFQLILFRHNEHELAAARALAVSLGVDKVTYKTAQVYDPDEAARFLPGNEAFRRYDLDGDAFRLRLRAGVHAGPPVVPNRCRTLWLQPVVNWDGTVTPCCFDKSADFVMGRLSGDDGTLAEVWDGGRLNAFRRRVLTGRARIDMCRNCTEGIRSTYAEQDLPRA